MQKTKTQLSTYVYESDKKKFMKLLNQKRKNGGCTCADFFSDIINVYQKEEKVKRNG